MLWKYAFNHDTLVNVSRYTTLVLGAEESSKMAADGLRTALSEQALDVIVFISRAVRYVAFVRNGELTTCEPPGVRNGSDSGSDRQEELVANCSLLGRASARGNLGCNGLDYLIVHYGKLCQSIMGFPDCHASLSFAPQCKPIPYVKSIKPALGAI